VDRIVEDHDLLDRLVHKWTSGKNDVHAAEGLFAADNDGDDGEDDIQHVLSFSREQLIEEEQELIQMASIPIPNETS